jgi:hypothetical protein
MGQAQEGADDDRDIVRVGREARVWALDQRPYQGGPHPRGSWRRAGEYDRGIEDGVIKQSASPDERGWTHR